MLPQAVNAALAGQTGPFQGAPEHLLAGARGQGLLGVVAGGEEPDFGTAGAPVGTEFVEQARGQERVPVFRALAEDDPDLHARAVNVLGAEMAGFVEAQARPVHRHEEGAGLGLGTADGEEPFELGAAEHLRSAGLRPDPRQQTLELVGGPVQDQIIEAAQPAQVLVERAGRQMPDAAQVEQVGLQLRVADPVRGAVVMLGQ